MFTSIDKAIVGFIMGAISLAAYFGIAIPDWLNETAVASVAATLTPILVYFVPNKTT